MVGYRLENWQDLENDLREQILPKEATSTKDMEFGQAYEIKGNLVGPNQSSLPVCTIWMTEYATGKTKFITMYPDKGR
jgi:hypothetical protein